MSEINLLYIDLFCGAGGTSTGVESARINGEQCAKVIASHVANHPEAQHFTAFIRIEGNVVIYEIYDTDSPMTMKIKEFMALYGILDIKMRMLKIPELKRIMGFPENYKLIGTQADQKKFVGNAVEVTMARVLYEAVSRKLRELRKVAA